MRNDWGKNRCFHPKDNPSLSLNGGLERGREQGHRFFMVTNKDITSLEGYERRLAEHLEAVRQVLQFFKNNKEE